MTTQRLLLAEPPDYSIPIAPEMRETFRVLDVVASGWIVVLSFTTTAPPVLPQQGDAYLVPAGATGAWEGHQNHLAIFTPVGWIFRAPRFGWIAVIADQNAPYGKVLQYSGTEWTGWILPASQVSFSTSGTDFVSTTLQELMVEINLRFLAAEATLTDHESRITVLENSLLGVFSGVRLTRSTGTAISSSTPIGAPLPWDTEAFDTDGYHSTVSNTSRVVAPFSGYYLAVGCVNVGAGPGFMSVTIVVNGSTNIAGHYPGEGEPNQPRLFVSSGPFHMNANDYVELYAFSTATANTSNTDGPTFFGVTYLGT